MTRAQAARSGAQVKAVWGHRIGRVRTLADIGLRPLRPTCFPSADAASHHVDSR